MLRAGGVGAAFLIVFAAAELWRRLGTPRPEWTRKLVHLGGGLVSLSLPWMIRSHWTILGLAVVFALIIVGSRRFGLLESVHGVERQSEGGLYFAVAVYLLYVVTADRPAFYLVSLLALVVADAMAALVGTSYGRHTFEVETGRKSLEGSSVFLFVTFLAAHLPLLLLTDIGRAESVLVAAQLALLVTIFEAISLKGNDNLIVPVGAYLLLVKMTPKTADFLALQLAAQLAILALLILLVWRVRVLTFSGTIAASLFFYGAWSLGDPRWVVAPAAGMLALLLVLRKVREQQGQPNPRYQVIATFYTAIVPGLVLVANNILETLVRHPQLGQEDPLYPLYLGALAAHLAILVRVFQKGMPWLKSWAPARWASSLGVGIFAVVPAGLLAAPAPLSVAAAGVAVLLPTLALLGYETAVRWPGWHREDHWDVRVQSLTVGAVTLALAAVLIVPLVGG